MFSKLQKLPDKSLELTITIPWPEVKITFEKVMEEVVKTAELPGFRKGKAPRKLVEEKIEKNKVYGETLQQLLPKYYAEAVKEQNLQPIINPKISIVTTEENKDWIFKAQTCEKPLVNLDSYKKEIAGETAKEKIWLPGKSQEKKPELTPEQEKQKRLNRAIEVLTKTAIVNLPAILVEDEVNRQLSQTLEEIKKLGLSLDQYLASTGKTPESLRAEQTTKAQTTLKLEFILEKIAEEEKIMISDAEIEKAITENPDKKVQDALRQNAYLLASVLRRQKTINFLSNL